MPVQHQAVSMKANIRKYSTAFAVLSSVGGFVGDVLQPLGPVLLYTSVLSATAAVALTAFKSRVSARAHVAAGFLWIWFACSGAFVTGQWALGATSNGLAADVIPGVSQFQDRLGLVQQRMDEVYAQTTEINEKTARIESSVSEINEGIRDLGQLGGIIADPQTPEQWYSNAKFYELKGDFGNARRSYLRCLQNMPEKIDAHLTFVQFLKAQEGRVGAREVYLPIARRSPGVGSSVALAVLLPPDDQATALEQIIVDEAIPAPVLFLIAERYSADRLGTQSLVDKGRELKWLDLFVAAVEDAQYLRYFSDQALAAQWSESAKTRLAKLKATTSTEILANPIQLSIQTSDSTIMVNLSIAESSVDVLWRQNESEEFRSTGLMNYINPDTGRRMPKTTIQLPIQDGDVQLEVMYLTPMGHEMGPFDLSFNALELVRAKTKEELNQFSSSWIKFRDRGGWVENLQRGLAEAFPDISNQRKEVSRYLIDFSGIVSKRLAVKSIRYKLGDDDSWVKFPVKTANSLRNLYAIGPDQKIHIPCTASTGRIRVQVEYYDGTLSSVNEYLQPAGGS